MIGTGIIRHHKIRSALKDTRTNISTETGYHNTFKCHSNAKLYAHNNILLRHFLNVEFVVD